LSRLNDDQVRAIQRLEQTLGKRLLAYDCHAIELAALTEAEIKRVNDVQKKLGLLLVAVE
jgi:hypothetical protein